MVPYVTRPVNSPPWLRTGALPAIYAECPQCSQSVSHRKDAGFSLAAIIFFATAASVLAAAAYPAYVMQAKRERELELVFRGEEYIRAIQKYQRKFGIYPTSVDQ